MYAYIETGNETREKKKKSVPIGPLISNFYSSLQLAFAVLLQIEMIYLLNLTKMNTKLDLKSKFENLLNPSHLFYFLIK
jgi:hypothetical protein